MTDAGPDTPGPAEWATAEAAAARHREQRLHPTVRARRAEAVLKPLAIVLWVVAFTAAVVSQWTRNLTGSVVAAGALVTLLAFGVVAFLWAHRTGRYLVSGSDRSIRTWLPAGAWRPVRAQLALRRPLDSSHRDVVIELAHQQRRLLGGQVVFAAFYIPFYLDLTRTSETWFRILILSIGAALLITGAAFGAVTYRRLTQLIALDHDHTPA